MYELNRVRQFLKVAEYGSIKKAAAFLNLTQPALSRSMSRLEEELGVSLFLRTKNTISLTENGEKAAAVLRGVYESALDAEKTIRLFAQSHKTIIAASPSPTLFGELKRRFALSHPSLSVQTTVSTFGKMVENLLCEKYAITQSAIPIENSEVYSAVFDEESLLLILSETHPLAKKTSGVYLKEIDGETVLALPEMGYWTMITSRLLPSSHFIFQKEKTDYEALIAASILPTFMTDKIIESHRLPEGRVAIPILDDYCNITVYCNCLIKNKDFFEPFLALCS